MADETKADAKSLAKVNRAAAIVKNPGGGEDLVTVDVTGEDGGRYAPSVTKSQARLLRDELNSLDLG